MDDFDPGAFLGEGTERLPALPRLCGGNRPGVMPTLPSLHGEVRMASQYSVATSPSCESINLMENRATTSGALSSATAPIIGKLELKLLFDS
jgi:hypothetical protein